MTLYINTASYDEIIIELKQGGKTLARKKFRAPRRQAERLVPAIDKLLSANGIKLKSLKKVVVANRGGNFTSLRIGVITANTLAYALKIPVEAEKQEDSKSKKFGAYRLVEPLYDREPTIGVSKKPKL